ncbi:MAG: MBL fold metallo-hydrolase [Candidatus Wallbacteria bacterium HGW-Wallbacteria-1]|jgi:glyoxylase-like metal-dependent hydrolase (beta-lactamase superfamily II)|uniref:MBL fold metallo-hydrolase n=1 Tax=Candidatus Wallbacteria bacterium HGW-Wallbacteria-1 TaxID=2013854 RepID=A0A2N1PJM9_9BACT|nr:MAG: MBL fold metallo-hydrolase [Candidatus Wallbacteria bacterium HGW-Wallbacteria-1]
MNYRVLALEKKMGPMDLTVHPLLLWSDSEVVLFDAGLPDQADLIQREMQALAGLGIEDLTAVVISHHDHDHIGSLAELKRRNSGIRVMASQIESDYISGIKPSLRILQAEEHNKGLSGAQLEFGQRFLAYLKTIEPCEVDTVLSAQDGPFISGLPGLRLIYTPGHMPGHVSLYLEDEKVLATGDALALEKGVLCLPNPQYTLDTKMSLESVKKLLVLPIDSIVCYHGGVLDHDIQASLKALTQGDHQ